MYCRKLHQWWELTSFQKPCFSCIAALVCHVQLTSKDVNMINNSAETSLSFSLNNRSGREHNCLLEIGMGFSKQTSAAITAAKNTASENHILNYQDPGRERKPSRRPRVSSKCQKCFLVWLQLWNHVSIIVKQRPLDNGLESGATKRQLLSKRKQLYFTFSEEVVWESWTIKCPQKNGESHHGSCVMQMIKHLETVHVLVCFSSSWVDLFAFLVMILCFPRCWSSML